MNKYLKIAIFFGVLACVSLSAFVACQTDAAVVVPEGLTPLTLTQMAQEAEDADRYEEAISYYNAIIARFTTDEFKAYVAQATYEIAFIRYKQGRLVEARELFLKLLDLYKGPNAALYPKRFKILGEMILAKIDAQLSAGSAAPSSSAMPSPTPMTLNPSPSPSPSALIGK